MITIDKSKCVGCGKCAEVCPTQAIQMVGNEVFVREGLCRACGACVEVCPKGAITMMKPSLYPYAFRGSLNDLTGINHGISPFHKRGGCHRHGRRRH
jgi:Fe-S-cluster-containing hydrogenase component 2